MALLRNTRNVYIMPGLLTGAYTYQMGNFAEGGRRNAFLGGFSQSASLPASGYLEESYVLPQKPGAMASFTDAVSSIEATLNLIPAATRTATDSSVLTKTNAEIGQVVNAIASALLQLSNQDAAAFATANIEASGNLNLDKLNAILEVIAIVLIEAQGSSELQKLDALCGAIFGTFANASCSITGDVSLTAEANMIATAGGPEPLSPQGLANAILDAMLADHNFAGTVGEALNNIGASSNPWSAPLDGNDSPDSFGEKVQQLLTKGQFLALKD